MTVRLLENPLIQDIGWTLVQFLWQGTLIAIVYAVARAWWGRSASPQTRYRMASSALAIMTAAPVATFLLRPRFAAPPLTAWPLASPDAWVPVMPWVVAAWTAGVLLFSIRLVGGWSAAFRLRRDRVRPAPPEWQRRLTELMDRVKVSRPVELLVSPLVDTPAVVGWWRPAILIPVGALTGMAPDYLEALLAHELAHVRRLDFLVNMLQGVAEAVLFYHPGVWWVSEHIRAERESICDDIAVAACGDVLIYTRALSELELHRIVQGQQALAANSGPLLARIRRLAGRSSLTSPLFPSMGTIVAIVIVWFAGVGSVVAQDPWVPTPPKPEPPPLLALNRSTAISTLLFSPQGPAPQPAKVPPAAAIATVAADTPGRVEGRVIDSNGQPVRNATVTLLKNRPAVNTRNQAANPEFYSTPAIDYATRSSDDGGFGLEQVEPGAYRVNVSRQGYLTQALGAAEPGTEQGAPVTVRAGQTLNGLLFKLTKQGIIAGRVMDGGEAVQGAEVRALRLAFVDGRRLMRLASLAVTDDIGGFRITSLTPGRYYLYTDPHNGPGGGGATLRLPTFAPNASTLARASIIDVAAGGEAHADIRIRREHLYRVRGTVIGVGGGPSPAKLVLDGDAERPPVPPSNARPLLSSTAPQAETTSTDPQGSFEVFLPPGEHTLMAFGGSQTGIVMYGATTYSSAPGRAEDNGSFVSERITVGGSDMEGVHLVLRAPAKIHGAIKLDQGTYADMLIARPGEAANSPLNILPWLIPAGRTAPANFRTAPDATTGTFEWNGFPGPYRFQYNVPNGYYVKAVLLNGKDILGKEWIFDGEESSLEIVYARGSATISGSVNNAGDDIAPGALAALWPKNPDGLTFRGNMRTATADAAGVFRFANVAPGEYYLAAFAPLSEPGILQNRPFLESFLGEAANVTVAPEEVISRKLNQIPAEKAAVEASRLP